MITIKNPFTRTKTLSRRASASLKSSSSTALPPPPILPNFPLTAVLQNSRPKKRLRFELTLEPVVEEEDSSISNYHNPVVPTIKPNKRIIHPWREDALLHSVHVNNLEKQDILTPDISVIHQTSLLPKSESYSDAFVMQNKSPELVMDLFGLTTPPFYLPSIVHRTKTTKKPNDNESRQSLNFVDYSLKKRVHLATPPRSIRSRKIIDSASKKTHWYPSVKRIDLTLPVMKDLHCNEKLIRTDNPFGIKTINECFPTKKTS